MSQRRLLEAVDLVGSRILRLKAWRWRTACWLALALLACALIVAKRWFALDISTNAIIGILGVGVVLSFILQTFMLRHPQTIDTARKIEAFHPDLNSALLAALDQQPEEPGGRLRYLQTKVIDKAVRHSTFSTWRDVVTAGQMRRWSIAGLTSLIVFLTCSIFAFDRPANALLGPAPVAKFSESTDGTIYGIVVEPGDTEIEKGTSLLVMARFEGQLPSKTSLDLKTADGEAQRLEMSPGVDSNLYLARVPSVDETGTYSIQYDDEQTGEFQVKVFTVPALDQADANITFPKYTNLEGRSVQDTRRISVVEGASVTWMFRLNKAVESAELRDKDGEVIQLSALDGAAVQGTTLTATKSRDFTLHLTDADGRTNKFPPDIKMSVVANQRPTLKLAFPGKDRPVSPLEEMVVEAKVSDDFGLDSYGVIYSLVGQDQQEVKLGEKAAAKQKHTATHVVQLESLKAEPDQLVSYFFYADDYGPDGEVRRTLSDMYFAEVRRFEEIFRQGRQQAGGQNQGQQQQQGQQGQQGSGQQLDQLGQLQKQIMTATWNIARRPSLDSRELEGLDAAKQDVRVLVESQGAAREQVQQLIEKMQDAEMQATAADLLDDMADAVSELEGFETVAVAETLQNALKAEQKAYQKILKLRAKEMQVQRQQQQQQQQKGQKGNSRSQQQMNQLEMKRQENRYQEQSQAQEEEAKVDQEQLRTLNRLRELARRQEAINEKLKQLESEMRQAKTAEEREEIERQLKRLRDEQQQMLRDIDEASEEIDKQRENLDQADQMQRQAQEARERALRTSEALKQNELSKAVSEGTRTERELKDLRDDFRKETANEFEDVMRQMRREARELDNKQEEIGKQIAENETTKSLRYAEERKEIEKQLRDQAERVTELSDKMREVVKQSEGTEPLLARTLYDEARKLKDRPPEKDLEAERFLVSRGFMEQAMEADKAAKEGIQRMREGIEKSAETVLGDELEGLKRAQRQMDRLQQQLDDEVARNTKQETDRQGARSQQQGDQQQQDGERPDGQQPSNREGQRGDRQQRDSENQNRQSGQQENGEQQEGERREGQQREGQQGQRNGQGQQGEPRESQQQREGQASGQQQPQNGDPQREGQQEGNRPGQGNGQQQQENDNQQQRDGQQPQNGQRPNGEQRRGQQPGQQGQGGQRDQQGQPRDGEPQQGQQRPGGLRGLRSVGQNTNGGAGGNPRYNPLTGDEYRQWTDGLRDIEEMLDDPEMRSDVARIRDRARSVRIDLKRHSKEPKWEVVREDIMMPMRELQQRLAEEIAKRESTDSLVPIDRDPVPNKYADMVRRYYERLGRTEDRPMQRASNRPRSTDESKSGANE